MAIRRLHNSLVLAAGLLAVATVTAGFAPGLSSAAGAGRAVVRHSGASPAHTIGGGRTVSLL
jgi:hypothetical protein